ncbi:MAG: exodeoxyribonuclease VII large subunit [Gammaproteobacteria bacterium]|nr:exodeoxyribonuclease VII large subunit [Gammaproteobacteria bacterium]
MPTKPDIYTVSRLNQEARLLLESGLGTVWLEAELSNLAQPSSGHWYFSLKDARSQVRCAMFKIQNSRLNFKPKDGDQVLVRAKVSVYEPRGDYQLIAEHMEAAGEGALRLAFEKLKAKLAAEGLFDEEHKQEVPELPQCIGVVTSATGAAVHDILTVLKRRFAALPVIIYPCLVQGREATASIVKAITTANVRQECDVLIVARGGGSLEDLWCFNEEAVARAIFASEIPIVSGVGHEVDVTIADFVADHRAATPSAAAEFVSPDRSEYADTLRGFASSLMNSIRNTVRHHLQQLHHLTKRLQHPGRKLQEQAQTIDYLQQLLHKTMRHKLERQQQKLASAARALDAYSPLATLGRGYSITQLGATIIRNANEVNIGDQITTQLHQGKLISKVEKIV